MSTSLDRGAYGQEDSRTNPQFYRGTQEEIEAAAKAFADSIPSRRLPEREAAQIIFSGGSSLSGGGLGQPPGDATPRAGEAIGTEVISGAVNGTPKVIDACVRGGWRDPEP